MSFVAIREEVLSIDEALDHVRHASAGGVDLFLGIVRDRSEGRDVTRLEYSAYASMALREMQAIADEVEQEFDVRACALHRVGSLSVGDVAVICVASAVHRDEAFRACRALIDRIKERVPIWKRELGPDGAAWVGWEDARCHAHPPHAGAHK